MKAKGPLPPSETLSPPRAGDSYAPVLLTSRPDETMTFDTLYPFEVNAFAIEIARVVADHGGSRPAYNPLYCYGAVGQGKTHLLSAIANRAKGRVALMVNAVDLEAEFERARHMAARAQLLAWIVSHDLLLLDDVQMCEENEEIQRELFTILNHMMHDGRSIVIASDVPPTKLSGIESRLLSRLGGGPIVALNMGTTEERKELLRSYLGQGVLSPEVLDYLAQRISSSVRRLKAAAKQLVALSEITGVPATVRMARAIVPMPEDSPRPPSRLEEPPASAPQKPRERDRFKDMVQNAESEDEQMLAMQIVLGERLRQLKEERSEPAMIARLEEALGLLRDGKLQEAMRRLEP